MISYVLVPFATVGAYISLIINFLSLFCSYFVSLCSFLQMKQHM